MSLIDIAILLVFIPFLISGIKNGFMVQATSLVALVAGAWLALRFSSLLSSRIAPYVGISTQVLNIISFVVIMIACVLLLALLGRGLKAVVKLALLGWLDKTLGALLAIVKAALILGIAVIIFTHLNGKFGWVEKEVLDSSLLYNPLKDLASAIFPYFKELIAQV